MKVDKLPVPYNDTVLIRSEGEEVSVGGVIIPVEQSQRIGIVEDMAADVESKEPNGLRVVFDCSHPSMELEYQGEKFYLIDRYNIRCFFPDDA